MQRLRRALVLGALVSAPGCTESDKDTTGTAGSTSSQDPTDTAGSASSQDPTDGTGGSTGTSPPECACIPEQPDGAPPSLPTCGKVLCPTIETVYDTGGIASETPEALTCALTALRDRTPGLIRWTSKHDLGGGWTEDGYVLLLGGDAAIRRDWGDHDLTYDVYDATHGTLAPPATFDACLAAELSWERAYCIFTVHLGEPFLVCDAGWSENYF